MLKLIALLVLASFVSVQGAQACSIAVNAKNLKNLMVAQAANKYGIGLDTATKISFSDFAKSGIGEDPSTLCPLKLKASVHVSIKYRPALTQRCELTVDVIRIENLATGAEAYTFKLPASSCEYVPLPVIIHP